MRRRLGQRPANARFEEVRAVLEAYGWFLSRVSGSHHIFQRGAAVFSLPYRKPTVKAPYVRRVLKLTEEED